MRSVSIIGCGWFGLPLAKQLLSDNFQVKGSKRTESAAQKLTTEGIEGFTLALPSDSPLPSALFNSDILVINLPPGLRKAESNYLAQLTQVIDATKGHHYDHIVYVSSSGVYAESGENIDEDSPIGSSTKAQTLFQAEQLVQQHISADKKTIFRFAGLVGPSRHPGRFLAGKTDVSGANLAVNLVHLQDIIAATRHVLIHKAGHGVFNICSDVHNSRKEFYTAAATALALVPPVFNQATKPQRQINGQRFAIEMKTKYAFNTLESLVSFGDSIDLLT